MTSEQSRRPNLITLDYERRLWAGGCRRVAGIDEAGRGPLAGPVVAAAVVFPPEFTIPAVNDSKLLTQAERESLYDEITGSAAGVGIGIVDHAVIDEINILNATYRAMHDAVSRLGAAPDHLLVDGNRFSDMGLPFTTIVDGDALCFCVAAASIIAKVTRDRIMMDYDVRFPGYGFARNKGYATREHCDAIVRLGYCGIHRKSFELNMQLELEL